MKSDPKSLQESLLKIFQQVFDDPSLEIKNNTTSRDIPSWDSLMHIQLIVAIERGFKIRFAAGEVEKLQNVGDMLKLISTKVSS